MSVVDEAASSRGRPDVDGAPTEVGPVMEGRWTRLRMMLPADVDWLYALSTDPDTTFRWRFHGETPSPQAFAAVLWQTVLAQFVVEERETGHRFGLVVAYGADQRNAHARVGVLFDTKHRERGWPLEACALFINYVFTLFPVRKLYFEGPDYNVAQYGSALGQFLVEEGRFREHVYYNRRYADLVTLALYRDTWLDRAVPIIARLLEE